MIYRTVICQKPTHNDDDECAVSLHEYHGINIDVCFHYILTNYWCQICDSNRFNL